MRTMKCMLISFIVVNLAFHGFIRSVFAADMAGEIEKINITLEIHDLLKQPGFTEFALKVNPLTIKEQVLLKNIEAKTENLLNQAAGKYYDDTYGKARGIEPYIFSENHPNTSDITGGAVIGAFFGWLASSGKDSESARKTVWTGAFCGAVIISMVYAF